MFCMECGTKLPDNAKFCFNCGNKIRSDSVTISPTPESGNTTTASTEFYALALPDVAKIYNDILSLAEKRSQSFIDSMYYNYDTLDAFCNQGFLAVRNLFDPVEEYALNLLRDHGIYHFSNSDILRYTRKYMGRSSEVLSELLAGYQKIIGDGEEIAVYNEYLKQNRSHFVGGGFGIAGAAKGIAVASALNATVGVFRSYVDKKNADALHSEIANQKHALYHSNEFRRALKFAIELDFKEAIHGICDLFSDCGLPTIPYYPIDNLMQAGNILDSVVNGIVPARDYEKVAYQVISLYPVHRDMYLYAADICPNNKHIFFSMANKYGIDIYEYYQQLDRTATQYAKKLTQNSLFQSIVRNSELKDNLCDSLAFFENAFHNYFDENFSICAGEKKNYARQLDRIRWLYARYSLDSEVPALFIDDTDHASYKHGVLLTSQFVYAISDCCKLQFPIKSIKSFALIHDQSNKYLQISTTDEMRNIPIKIKDYNETLMLDLLDFFVNYCLYIENTPNIHVLSKPTIEDFKVRILALAGNPNLIKCTETSPADAVKNTEGTPDAITIMAQIEQAILSCKQMPPYYGKTIRKATDTTFSMLERDLSVMKKIFPDAFTSGEQLLYYYDRTIFGTGAESFLMTDKFFYCHSEKNESWRIAYKDIVSVSTAKNFWSELEINGRIVPISLLGDDQDFASDLKNFFIPTIMQCMGSKSISHGVTPTSAASIAGNSNTDGSYDEDSYITTCPECENDIPFGESVWKKGELVCPYCGEIMFFDSDDCEDDKDEYLNVNDSKSPSNSASIAGVYEQIRCICSQFLSCHNQDSYRVEQKLLSGLNIGNQEDVFLGHDDTVFRSGKNGFAITSKGIYCCDMLSEPVFTSYSDFSKAERIYKKSTYIYADKCLLAYAGAAMWDLPDLLALFQDIHDLLQ